VATLPAAEDRILSVGELTAAIKDLLQGTFPGQWVKGEISGYKGANPSGHLYFKMKDADAQMDCAMFKGSATKLGFTPKDGLEVEAYGEISVYPPRGNYQLVVKQMRVAGIGALLAQLEELKRRLAAEGLFDAARKQPLPRYPATVGVVTSPVGAAVRDIVKVLRTRWPGIRIVLAPVKVQGQGAAAEIAAAIERFDRWGGADVLIVGRGGGSIEDLRRSTRRWSCAPSRPRARPSSRRSGTKWTRRSPTSQPTCARPHPATPPRSPCATRRPRGATSPTWSVASTRSCATGSTSCGASSRRSSSSMASGE
jgi:hypothetical protein